MHNSKFSWRRMQGPQTPTRMNRMKNRSIIEEPELPLFVGNYDEGPMLVGNHDEGATASQDARSASQDARNLPEPMAEPPERSGIGRERTKSEKLLTTINFLGRSSLIHQRRESMDGSPDYRDTLDYVAAVLEKEKLEEMQLPYGIRHVSSQDPPKPRCADHRVCSQCGVDLKIALNDQQKQKFRKEKFVCLSDHSDWTSECSRCHNYFCFRHAYSHVCFPIDTLNKMPSHLKESYADRVMQQAIRLLQCTAGELKNQSVTILMQTQRR